MQRRELQQLCAAAGLAAALIGHAAHAQDVSASPDAGTRFDRGRTTAVKERVQPGYEEIGLRQGSFYIQPRLEIAAFADDNVYATQDDRTSGAGVLLAPTLRVRSDWSRHQAALSASGVASRFFGRSRENYETFNVRAEGRYDADAHWRLYGIVGYRRDVERRSDAGALRNTLRPVRYDTANAGGRLTWQGNSLRLAADTNFSRTYYDDVVTSTGNALNSGTLGRRIVRASGRADYAVSANMAVVAIGAETWIDYPGITPGTALDFSSRKTELLAGVSFEFTDLLRGEATAGYIAQNFKDARIKDFSGFGGRVQVEYFPTRLTTVRLGVSRTQNEAGNPFAPSYRRTRAELQVDHELFRYLIVSANADYERDRFQLPDRTERRTHFGVSMQYILDRHFTVIARADHLRASTDPASVGRRFTDNTVLLGVAIRP